MVIPKDHLVTAADEVAVEDLADEIVLHPMDDVLGWGRLPGRPALGVRPPRRTQSSWWRPGSACC